MTTVSAASMPPAAAAAHARASRTGVLLVNLGTPDAPEPGAIRRYLAEFLSDRRVVEIPRPVWWLILHAFVLPLRPRRLVHPYQLIWRPDGSPLLAISRLQQAGLQQALGSMAVVALAMRYGEPSISRALGELDAQDVRRLLVLPLFPQYSGSTTGSALEAIYRALMRRRWIPELRSLGGYHDHPAYIDALAQSIAEYRQKAAAFGHLLISFHGLPQRYVLAGDPYYCQCHKTARLLAERAGLVPGAWSVSFQSRFGRAPWVGPATDTHLVALASRGVRRVAVICPGFAADCLETLEEVSLRYRALFLASGGEQFDYLPALNDSPAHLDALLAIVRESLTGWANKDASLDSVTLRQERASVHVNGFSGRPG